MASRHGAINLGQGFPDFDCDPALVEAVSRAMRAGLNQYPPMQGWPALRQAIARHVAARHGFAADANDEVTITAGATQAILTALLALTRPGDEVIVLDPSYDSYVPSIRLASAVPVRVPLEPETHLPDFGAIGRAMSKRTRALIVNSPHNPTGRVWNDDHWRRLAELLAGGSMLLISDEVYEHMTFDGHRHISAIDLPELRERSLVISSFGKTFHVTGWKVGYVVATAAMMREFRKVHQFNVFTVNTPMQAGLADYLEARPDFGNLSTFYQAKRDRLRAGLETSRLRSLPCEGTYFQCADYSAVSDRSDIEFCEWLTTTQGVAAIPLSPFHPVDPGARIVRFCFAKKDETLDRAIDRLRRL